MSAPRPKFHGTLERVPLPDLLVEVLDRRASGTLVVEEPDGGKSAVLFRNGAPSKARTSAPIEHLGRILLEQGAIDDGALDRSLSRVASEGRLQGELLLEVGALEQAALQRALEEQVRRKVLWLGSLPGASAWGFYEGVDYLTRWGGAPTPVEPLPLVWAAVRAFASEAALDATLGELGARAVRLHVDAQPARFRLEPPAQAFLDVLRARPAPAAELLGCGVCAPSLGRRLLHLLRLCRALDEDLSGNVPVGVDEPPASSRRGPPEVGSRRRAPENAPGNRRAPPSAPDAVSTRSAELAVELDGLAASLDALNHYDLLGVPETATTGAIQAAFVQRAKRFHPDRLPPDLADRRGLATRVFARMNEAHATLTDEKRRAEYDRTRAQGASGAEEQAAVQRALDAAMAFQRAEVLLKKNDIDGAERELAQALAADPEQPEYLALSGWLGALRARDAAGLAGPIQLLTRAVDAAPDVVRFRLWRGQVLSRAGQAKRALSDFRQVLAKDPRNVDAQRELRLHEMRSGKAAPGGAGLLDKLFKKS